MKKLIRLSNHIYYYPYDTHGDRPNLYYIKGKDYSIVIDAGNSKRHVEEFYSALKQNNFIDPKYTIITHWHWDHTFGMKYAKGEKVSSIKTYQKLQEIKQYKWTIEEMNKRLEAKIENSFCHENILLEYQDLNDIEVDLPDTYITKDTTYNLGDLEIQVLFGTSTHTEDSIFIYIPEDKVLIVSDGDCPDYYISQEYLDKKKLTDMINFFKSLDYEYHCLGHAFPETKSYALERLNNELNKFTI
ncbi:MAG: MBL fold metallo-hydrolase [Firmicutes bacterium]|nr:MBL fold metallo-hydrolase [Candidatus Colivicinus equi]